MLSQFTGLVGAGRRRFVASCIASIPKMGALQFFQRLTYAMASQMRRVREKNTETPKKSEPTGTVCGGAITYSVQTGCDRVLTAERHWWRSLRSVRVNEMEHWTQERECQWSGCCVSLTEPVSAAIAAAVGFQVHAAGAAGIARSFQQLETSGRSTRTAQNQGCGIMSTTTTIAASKANRVASVDPAPDERDFQGFSDSRLVELARDGNQDAFGELVHRYEGRLVRVISRFIVDQDTIEDLAQDVFLRVYRRLELFDPSRRFGPWLFQIGVNLTLDHLRKTQRRIRWTQFSQRREEESRSLEPAVPDPRTDLDLSQEVRAVLKKVPEKYRTVLVLRDLENFSTSEIAAILDRKEATIRWRLAEARSKFQKLWAARQNQDAAVISEPKVEANEL